MRTAIEALAMIAIEGGIVFLVYEYLKAVSDLDKRREKERRKYAQRQKEGEKDKISRP